MDNPKKKVMPVKVVSL